MHVSILCCERMAENEAIYMGNLRRFSEYDGYHKTLKLKGSADPVRPRANFIAIDAKKYFKDDKSESQYKLGNVLRDLNKSLIGFTLPTRFE